MTKDLCAVMCEGRLRQTKRQATNIYRIGRADTPVIPAIHIPVIHVHIHVHVH